MNITKTNIEGLLVIESEIFSDSRGFFIEQYQQEKLQSLGFPKEFSPIQINFVKNDRKGTLRGLHGEPWDKYVSVIAGEGFGAWVDLRDPSKKNVFTHRLVPGIAIYVPQGVANSYQTLKDDTYYIYAVNGHWKKDLKYTGIYPFDETLKIEWPLGVEESILSEKDKAQPKWKELYG